MDTFKLQQLKDKIVSRKNAVAKNCWEKIYCKNNDDVDVQMYKSFLVWGQSQCRSNSDDMHGRLPQIREHAISGNVTSFLFSGTEQIRSHTHTSVHPTTRTKQDESFERKWEINKARYHGVLTDRREQQCNIWIQKNNNMDTAQNAHGIMKKRIT